jgi:hypothetical protein
MICCVNACTGTNTANLSKPTACMNRSIASTLPRTWQDIQVVRPHRHLLLATVYLDKKVIRRSTSTMSLQPCYFDKWDIFADNGIANTIMGFPLCIFKYLGWLVNHNFLPLFPISCHLLMSEWDHSPILETLFVPENRIPFHLYFSLPIFVRKNDRSIVLIPKPMYVEDLTLYLSD